MSSTKEKIERQVIKPKDFTSTYPNGNGITTSIEINPEYLKPKVRVEEYAYVILIGRHGHENYYGYDYCDGKENREAILRYFIQEKHKNKIDMPLWCRFGTLRKIFVTLTEGTKVIELEKITQLHWESQYYFFDTISLLDAVELKILSPHEILNTPGGRTYKFTDGDTKKHLVHLNNERVQDAWTMKDGEALCNVSSILK